MIENYKKTKEEVFNCIETTNPEQLYPNIVMMGQFVNFFVDKQTKIINVNKNENNLFLNTKNDIFPRKPPFIKFFLDTKIIIDNLLIYGLSVITGTTDDDLLKSKGIYEGDMIKKQLECILTPHDMDLSILNKKYLLSFLFLAKNLETDHYLFGGDSIEFPNSNFEGNEKFMEYLNLNRIKYTKNSGYDKTMEKIKLFVCNFLDFLNHPEIELAHHNMDKINKRRQKHNKKLLPSYYNVKMSHTLRRFVNEYGQSSRKAKYSHKFWVRGHFKRFWDKEKYHILYEKHNDGILDKWYQYDNEYDVIMRWVQPYIKGEGILPNQIYEIGDKK